MSRKMRQAILQLANSRQLDLSILSEAMIACSLAFLATVANLSAAKCVVQWLIQEEGNVCTKQLCAAKKANLA